MLCGYHRSQKQVLDPLKLEFLVFVSHFMWVLVTEPQSSARDASALNYQAI